MVKNSRRLSRLLLSSFIASSSSPHHSRTFTAISSSSSSSHLLTSPDCFQSSVPTATTTNGNLHRRRPWFTSQYRGVKVNAINLRPGNLIEKSGKIYQVVESEHKQRGRGGASMTVELRDVDTGNKQTLRLGPEDGVERVYVEESSFTFLYTEHETTYLMDLEKFEQLEVPVSLFGKSAAYLKEEMEVKLQLYDGKPLSGSVPKQVTCTIKEIQDRAATPRYNKAVLDNDVIVQVPPYIVVGEAIVVKTDDDSYVTSFIPEEKKLRNLSLHWSEIFGDNATYRAIPVYFVLFLHRQLRLYGVNMPLQCLIPKWTTT